MQRMSRTQGDERLKDLGSINIETSLLLEALVAVVPERRKNSRSKKLWPVTLCLDAKEKMLDVFESNHSLNG